MRMQILYPFTKRIRTVDPSRWFCTKEMAELNLKSTKPKAPWQSLTGPGAEWNGAMGVSFFPSNLKLPNLRYLLCKKNLAFVSQIPASPPLIFCRRFNRTLDTRHAGTCIKETAELKSKYSHSTNKSQGQTSTANLPAGEFSIFFHIPLSEDNITGNVLAFLKSITCLDGVVSETLPFAMLCTALPEREVNFYRIDLLAERPESSVNSPHALEVLPLDFIARSFPNYQNKRARWISQYEHRRIIFSGCSVLSNGSEEATLNRRGS